MLNVAASSSHPIKCTCEKGRAMKLRIPVAPLCAVHGVECYVDEADCMAKQTKSFLHTHEELDGPLEGDDPRRFVCPSACAVCNPGAA
jgi:hypothetical protein